MKRTQDKVVMVTGGALGLGNATARRLADEGAKIVLTDVNEEEGTKAVERLRKDGAEAVFVNHDVSSEDAWENAITLALKTFGRLDGLVNNAGVALTKTVEDTSLEEWRWLMSINLDGVFLGTRFGIQTMKQSGGGTIVNLSSIEGLIGDPTLAAYNASKGGVRIFTKSAALHCAKAGYNIRINSVHPGYIDTPMVAGIAESSGDAENARQELVSLHPLGHLGEPDDIAWGIVYLISDESKFMTGSELVIDGGYTAQ